MSASIRSLPESRAVRPECILGAVLLLVGVCVTVAFVGAGAAAAFVVGGMLLGLPQARARRCTERNARVELERLEASLDHERRTALETHAGLRERVEELEREGEELRREQRMIERAASGKGSFLANMSHEIRTPMSGILGMVDLLLGSDLGIEQRDIATTIHASSQQVLSILNDILDFSKLEAGKMELDANEFDVRGQAQNAVEMLASQATVKGIELSCLVDADVPERVIGDEKRLVQLLVNLLSNAVKFTDEGGVTLRVLRRGEGEGCVRIEFRVEDSGPGIPDELQALLFRPFTQLDTPSAQKQGGTGLGLAISRQLASIMGGELKVESRVGEGSAFYFEACFDPVQEAPVALAEGFDSLAGKRALVVDASPTARRAVVTYAGAFGLRVDEAGQGEVVLDMLNAAQVEGEPYAYVFLDRDLPRMDGRELASRIKSQAPLKGTSLVLCNTIDRMDKPAGLVRAGLDAWVTKPIGQEKLRTVLQHLLEAEGVAKREERPVRWEARGFDGLRVLLVEDNVVNQKVASLLLRRLGCEVVLAKNGQQAVERAGAEDFALILMDSKMPIMDGFEATAAIRSLPDSERAGVPIIAMTASAMPGDRERCLEAGMNDYMSKPVQGEALESMLVRWSEGRREEVDTHGGAEMTESHESHDDAAILDREVVESLRSLGESTGSDLFAELVGLFLEDTPARLQALKAAFESGDLGTMEAEAHALKSSCANLGALTLSSVFQGIEQAGRERDAGRAAELMAGAQDEYTRVQEALELEVG